MAFRRWLVLVTNIGHLHCHFHRYPSSRHGRPFSPSPSKAISFAKACARLSQARDSIPVSVLTPHSLSLRASNFLLRPRRCYPSAVPLGTDSVGSGNFYTLELSCPMLNGVFHRFSPGN